MHIPTASQKLPKWTNKDKVVHYNRSRKQIQLENEFGVPKLVGVQAEFDCTGAMWESQIT